jgi:methanogenic corrinoid protein MtbC1
MRAHLDRGLSAAEAARATLEGARPSTAPVLDAGSEELVRAVEHLDESAAQAALDGLLAALSLDVVLEEVLIPYLHELGERWERGEVSIAQEHFASNVIRGRLLGLARGWDRGVGPRALLACAEGEQHDLPLLLFGLALRAHGWRIGYLGADTPVASVIDAVRLLDPAAVVVSGTLPGVLEPLAERLREVAEHTRLYLAGGDASQTVAQAANGEYLGVSLVEAARVVAGRTA